MIYLPTDGTTCALIVSPCPTTPGGYRLTRWDHIGPAGHTEHATKADALKELRKQVGPWKAVPQWEEPARPSTHYLATKEPDWLGTEVITGGERWMPNQ